MKENSLPLYLTIFVCMFWVHFTEAHTTRHFNKTTEQFFSEAQAKQKINTKTKKLTKAPKKQKKKLKRDFKWNWWGFLLGFCLFLFGFLIALVISKDRGFHKSAVWGSLVFLLVLSLFILALYLGVFPPFE